MQPSSSDGLELLKQARKDIYEKRQRFICYALRFADTSVDRNTRLKSAELVRKAIAPYNTFEEWLSDGCCPSIWSSAFARATLWQRARRARLKFLDAWIDATEKALKEVTSAHHA